MSFSCDICNSVLSSAKGLDIHKKTAKKCLQLQVKSSDDEIVAAQSHTDPLDRISCQMCSTSITKSNYRRHLTKYCKIFDPSKYEYFKGAIVERKTPEADSYMISEIKTLRETAAAQQKIITDQKDAEIKSLKLELLEQKKNDRYIKHIKTMEKKVMESKNRRSFKSFDGVVSFKALVKRYVTNPLDISTETCEKVVKDKLSLKHIKDGESGIVNFFLDQLIRDKNGNVHIVCFTRTNKILKYMNENGDMVSDTNGIVLLHNLNKNLMPFIVSGALGSASEEKGVPTKLTKAFIAALVVRIFVSKDGGKNPLRDPIGEIEITPSDSGGPVSRKKESQKPVKSWTLTKKDRTDVWNFYIGANFGTYKCLFCTFKTVDKGLGDWHCGHVVPRSVGGKTILSNLRPICADCNLSMSDTPMLAYCLQRHNTGAIERLQLTGSPLEDKSIV